jgi:hypothetical protein
VSELTLQAAGPIFDITSILIEALNGGSVESLITTSGILSGLYASLNLAGPISFGYIEEGIAFGLFNWVEMNFQESAALTYSARIRENFLVGGGYSYRFPFPARSKNDLDIGLFAKVLLRGDVLAEKDMLGLVSVFSDPLSLLLSEPYSFSFAVGFDAGIRYSFDDLITVGIACRDAYTRNFKYTYSSLTAFMADEAPAKENAPLPLDLSAGVVFTPHLRYLNRWFSALKFMLDYNDILGAVTHADTVKHWILNLSFGMEIELMQVLSVQCGLSQGLFTSGLSLDLTIFRFYLSMFGTEASIEPGLKPVYNVMIGIDFSY